MKLTPDSRIVIFTLIENVIRAYVVLKNANSLYTKEVYQDKTAVKRVHLVKLTVDSIIRSIYAIYM